MGAQINDLQRKLLICKESENRVFRFPWSKKAMDGRFTTSFIIRRRFACFLLISLPIGLMFCHAYCTNHVLIG